MRKTSIIATISLALAASVASVAMASDHGRPRHHGDWGHHSRSHDTGWEHQERRHSRRHHGKHRRHHSRQYYGHDAYHHQHRRWSRSTQRW